MTHSSLKKNAIYHFEQKTGPHNKYHTKKNLNKLHSAA